MYVVTGATGNTGKIVAEQLLAAGKKVKAISRSETHLKDMVAKGAIPAVGDLGDAAFVKSSFQGAEGAYALIPPRFDAPDFRAYQKEIAQNLARAIEANDVPYVVTLSSYGAHLREGAGVVSGLYPLEQFINKISATSVLHLRAGYFLENFYASIPVIKEQQILGGFPITGDVELEMVFTADIGKTAADKLLKKDFQGNQVAFLSSKHSYTLNEAAKILGKAIGKPELTYVAFPAEGARQAMVGMGMSESLADQYVEFSKAASEGKLSGENGHHPKIDTPTSLEDFSKFFAGAFRG